jgi:hypothetical protein
MGNVLQEYGIDPNTCPPAAALVLITSLSRVLVMEESLGVFGGHAETFALVEKYLVQLEGERLPDTN